MHNYISIYTHALLVLPRWYLKTSNFGRGTCEERTDVDCLTFEPRDGGWWKTWSCISEYIRIYEIINIHKYVYIYIYVVDDASYLYIYIYSIYIYSTIYKYALLIFVTFCKRVAKRIHEGHWCSFFGHLQGLRLEIVRQELRGTGTLRKRLWKNHQRWA